MHSNMRQYCNLVGANLEVMTEALSFINVSYLLPLCISGPPYDTHEEEGGVNMTCIVRMRVDKFGCFLCAWKRQFSNFCEFVA